MSLIASTRGVALLPAYAQNFMPWSVISRPLKGEAPTIDLGDLAKLPNQVVAGEAGTRREWDSLV
jgi:hypothetical protein